MKDHRLNFDATSRNTVPILEVLKPLFGEVPCNILEIASGSGQHSVYMTKACPNLIWWPSDLDIRHIESINAWRDLENSQAIQPPRRIDVTGKNWRCGAHFEGWPEKFDAVICVNMIHISPWEAAEGLIEGAAARIGKNGFLYLYGPFKRDGVHTAPSNLAFDESLRSRDPSWGVRDVTDVKILANQHGFELEHEIEMPANNLSLIFRKNQEK